MSQREAPRVFNTDSFGAVSMVNLEQSFQFSEEASLKEALQQYQSSDKFRRLRPNSQKAYIGDLGNFSGFLEELEVTSIGQITPDVLQAYKEYRRRKSSQRSFMRSIASTRSFGNWVNDRLSKDSRISLETLSIEKYPERNLLNPLSKRQVSELLDKTKGNVRDSAILMICLYTGATSDEIANLKTEDVADYGDTVGIRFREKRERVIPLSEEVSDIIRRQKENQQDDKGESPLFPGLHPIRNKFLTRQGVWFIVGRRGETIGLSGLKPRDLRDTFIMHAPINSPSELAELLGIAIYTSKELITRRNKTRAALGVQSK